MTPHDPPGTGPDEDHAFARIKPRILRQEVLDALRKAILNEDLEVGSRLLEAEVATQMGVSRAPVREAIRQLEQEGLVQFAPHRGAVVLGLPEAEIDAIYEMRAVLEGRAMGRVAVSFTAEQDARLSKIVDQMRAPLEADDVESVAELDWELHGLIMELSEFTLLRRTWASLSGLVRLRSYQVLGQGGPAAEYFKRTAIQSHVDLIDALRTGDPEHAIAVGRAHVLEVSTRLAEERRQ